jgi:hypothetical protein
MPKQGLTYYVLNDEVIRWTRQNIGQAVNSA